MIITITISDKKVLKAINAGMIKDGYSKDDVLDDISLVDSQDIARWITPSLDIEDKNIEIERD